MALCLVIPLNPRMFIEIIFMSRPGEQVTLLEEPEMSGVILQHFLNEQIMEYRDPKYQRML